MHPLASSLARQCRVFRVLALSIVVAFGALPRPPALAATACFKNTSSPAAGTAVQGHIGASAHNIGYAGTFNIQIDGEVPPTREAYCVDIGNPISPGDTVPQAPVDYPVTGAVHPEQRVPAAEHDRHPAGVGERRGRRMPSARSGATPTTWFATPRERTWARARAEIVAAANAAGPQSLGIWSRRASRWGSRRRRPTSCPATPATRSARRCSTATAIRCPVTPSTCR